MGVNEENNRARFYREEVETGRSVNWLREKKRGTRKSERVTLKSPTQVAEKRIHLLRMAGKFINYDLA